MSYFSLYNRGQNKVDHSLFNPVYIQLNLAYMKPEMYTFTQVMFSIDTFFFMDDVKLIKRARGSPLLEFINVKCLVGIPPYVGYFVL